MMTKKHFNAIATIIRINLERSKDDEGQIFRLTVVAHEMAQIFPAFNPSFKPEEFLEACGI